MTQPTPAPSAYRIWPLTFSPSPGPARLNADRTPSFITSVLVDRVGPDGKEVEVARLSMRGAPSRIAELELIRLAKIRARLDAHRAGTLDDGFSLTSEPPSVLAKLTPEAEFELYRREMSYKDNS